MYPDRTLTRQNTIIWFAFLFLFFLEQEFGEEAKILMGKLLRRAPVDAEQPVRRHSIASGIAAILFLSGLVGFMAFVLWFGSPVLGDQGAHPFPSFHVGNIVFLLMLMPALFLPLHIANLPRIVSYLSQHWLWLLPTIAAIFFLYMTFYVNNHDYNQDIDSVFLRNRILVFSTLTGWHKAAFFLPVLWSILSLIVTNLRRPIFYWIYPLAFAFLLPSWLIEQRYYFIPLALFLLFREERSRKLEWISAIYGIVCTIALFIPVALRRFFL